MHLLPTHHQCVWTFPQKLMHISVPQKRRSSASLAYVLMDDGEQGFPLYEAVFQSFQVPPKHLESDTKKKMVHSCLHLGTRLLSRSLRRHPPCHGKKAKETGGGSKIAQNPCLSQKQQKYANQHEKYNAS